MYSNDLVCDIVEYLNNNINKEITIDELSIKFYFNKTYIMKRFKKELKITINEYINTIRVFNSLKYYRDDNYILSIAFRNGFNSLEYYSETFRKHIGVNPMIYKKYINNRMINNKDMNKIIENIARINGIISNTERYLNHRKPIYTNQTKKLIFK